MGLDILSKKEKENFPLKCGITCIGILSETRWLAFATTGKNEKFQETNVLIIY